MPTALIQIYSEGEQRYEYTKGEEMSEAGIEKIAVTLNEKSLALNWDTGKVA